MGAKHFNPYLSKGPRPSTRFFGDSDGVEERKEQPEYGLATIPIDDVIHQGKVVKHFADKLYRFIKPDDGSGDVFFHFDEVIADCLGRKLTPIGSRVEFQMGRKEGHDRTRAVNIRSLELEGVDSSTYRETSIIVRWFKDDRGGSGLARRPDGGTVVVSDVDVITDGVETLDVGGRIFHGVYPPEPGQIFWRAVDIEVCLPESGPEPESIPDPTWDAVVAGIKPIEHDDVLEIPETGLPCCWLPHLRNVPLRKIRFRKVA